MASPSLSLLSLPPELILEIADYLPLDGILALKLTHRILTYSLPMAPRLRNQTLSQCTRLALRNYLAKPVPNPTHLRCILCKAVYPLKTFQSSSSPACVSVSSEFDVEDADVVKLPQRLCAWHVGRLARIVHTEPDGRNEWVDSSEEMCMHCGAIQSWARCDCQCDSCSVRAVTAFTRYLNNNTECRKFVFYRTVMPDSTVSPENTERSQLFVRETCLQPGTYLDIILAPLNADSNVDSVDQTSIIHMPVLHASCVVSQ